MAVLEKLVNRQFRENFLKIKLSTKKKQKVLPCITVSQENGSSGRPIARLVAKKLKFKFFDKELIELIAKNSQVKKSLVHSLDEKTQGSIESIIDSFLGLRSFSEHTYIKSLAKVVLSICSKENAVILGRGGNFIVLPDQSLRVRIIAPFKTRIKNSKKYEYPKLSEMDIREKLLKVHIERKEFIRKYFHKNISNANYYDLVINTQRLSLDQSTEIITSAYKNKFNL